MIQTLDIAGGPFLRSSVENPATPISPAWFSGGYGSTSAGVNVNPDSAMNVAVVNACIRILSDGLARTPLLTLRKLPGGGSEHAEEHYLWARLMKSANPRMTSYRFKRIMHAWMLRFGNAFATLEISSNGIVTALTPHHPRKVRKLESGFMIGDQAYSADRVLHIRGMELDDDGMGKSVVTMAAESIGVAIAEQQYGGATFANGAQMGGFIKVPTTMKKDDKASFLAYLERRHRGAANSGRWEVLDGDMEIERTTMPAQDAQFLQTCKFTVEEIAGRWFGVPPSMVGALGDAKYSDIEYLNREFAEYSLDPHFCNWEAEINTSLLSPQQSREYMTRFDRSKLTRGAYKDQVAALGVLRQNGFVTGNEGRTELGMNPHADGDDLLANGTMTPVKVLAQKTAADLAPVKGAQP